MTDLSPAAQAIVDAWDAKLNPDPDGLTYLTRDPEHEALAAALEAVADQVVPEQGCQIYGLTQRENERQQVREEILSIAAELKQ